MVTSPSHSTRRQARLVQHHVGRMARQAIGVDRIGRWPAGPSRQRARIARQIDADRARRGARHARAQAPHQPASRQARVRASTASTTLPGHSRRGSRLAVIGCVTPLVLVQRAISTALRARAAGEHGIEAAEAVGAGIGAERRPASRSCRHRPRLRRPCTPASPPKAMPPTGSFGCHLAAAAIGNAGDERTRRHRAQSARAGSSLVPGATVAVGVVGHQIGLGHPVIVVGAGQHARC